MRGAPQRGGQAHFADQALNLREAPAACRPAIETSIAKTSESRRGANAARFPAQRS